MNQIAQALGFIPKEAFKTDVNLLVKFDDPNEVKEITPNYLKLTKLPFQGLIITSRSIDNRFDFISCYFAPQVGINEGPVTGSPHCSLAPY